MKQKLSLNIGTVILIYLIFSVLAFWIPIIRWMTTWNIGGTPPSDISAAPSPILTRTDHYNTDKLIFVTNKIILLSGDWYEITETLDDEVVKITYYQNERPVFSRECSDDKRVSYRDTLHWDTLYDYDENGILTHSYTAPAAYCSHHSPSDLQLLELLCAGLGCPLCEKVGQHYEVPDFTYVGPPPPPDPRPLYYCPDCEMKDRRTFENDYPYTKKFYRTTGQLEKEISYSYSDSRDYSTTTVTYDEQGRQIEQITESVFNSNRSIYSTSTVYDGNTTTVYRESTENRPSSSEHRLDIFSTTNDPFRYTYRTESHESGVLHTRKINARQKRPFPLQTHTSTRYWGPAYDEYFYSVDRPFYSCDTKFSLSSDNSIRSITIHLPFLLEKIAFHHDLPTSITIPFA